MTAKKGCLKGNTHRCYEILEQMTETLFGQPIRKLALPKHLERQTSFSTSHQLIPISPHGIKHHIRFFRWASHCCCLSWLVKNEHQSSMARDNSMYTSITYIYMICMHIYAHAYHIRYSDSKWQTIFQPIDVVIFGNC